MSIQESDTIPSSTVIMCEECKSPILLTIAKVYGTTYYVEFPHRMEVIRNRAELIASDDESWYQAGYKCTICSHFMRMYAIFSGCPKEPLKSHHLDKLDCETPERKRYCGNLYRRQIKYRRKK